MYWGLCFPIFVVVATASAHGSFVCDGTAPDECDAHMVLLQTQVRLQSETTGQGGMPIHIDEAKATAGVETTSKKPRLYVHGAGYDTGTNLIYKLLEKNFPDEFDNFCHPSRHTPQDKWPQLFLDPPCFGLAKQMSEYDPIEKWALANNITVLLSIVRSPLAQIHSWRKAPYTISPCLERPPEQYNESCHDWLRGQRFASTMDVYNEQLRLEKRLRTNGLFKKVIPITYEQLVLDDVEPIMQKLADALQLDMPKKLQTQDAPANPSHGYQNGREEAKLKLQERPWLHDSSFSSQVLTMMCNGLSHSDQAGLFEGSSGRKYTQDCADILGKDLP